MKKVPSYPKITAKTNITVTQTQNININSPKALAIKKGFKNDSKKPKPTNTMIKNDSSANLIKNQPKKYTDPARKSSKKGFRQVKDVLNEKSIKNSKSQRELAMLSQKLKKLEEKIKKLKQKQKQKQKGEKNSSVSQRSFSKNRQNSNHAKREATSSRKQLTIAHKYFLNKAQSHKALKKSYSDKLQFQIPMPVKKKKRSQVLKSSKSESQQIHRIKFEQKQKHDQQILHKFVTQVPNTHLHHNLDLKQSVQKSLPNNHYSMTPQNHSEQYQQQQDQNQLYYIGKAIKSLTRPALFPIREHLVQSLQTFQFLQNIKKPSQKEIERKQVHLPQAKFRHTIVLDLDETLIHCNETLAIPHDVKLNIKFPTGERIDAGVNIRPHAREFLKQLSQICEVVVFTASHECYATVVLDHLDPKRQMISHRLFREHCWQTQQGVYIKDLRVLRNRSLDNVLLIDNAAYSYYFQLENGVPIVPYYDDKHDEELPMLLAYIRETIASAQKSGQGQNLSLRKLNEKYFRLMDYGRFQDIGPLVEELYSTDGSSLGT